MNLVKPYQAPTAPRAPYRGGQMGYGSGLLQTMAFVASFVSLLFLQWLALKILGFWDASTVASAPESGAKWAGGLCNVPNSESRELG